MSWRRASIVNLEIANFKRFHGTNPPHNLEFGVPEQGDKSLYLIGGDNGSGKTSIHEAISYALYEEDDLPGIQTKPNYLRAVSERLNRQALDEGQGEYWVALHLLLQGGGPDRLLRIRRDWHVDVSRRRALSSTLAITENGRELDLGSERDDPYRYREFLRNLIPPRIAPFFFFDGERIQDFADDDLHERKLVEAIEDILHISVYKQLGRDIKGFVVDYYGKSNVRGNGTDDLFRLQEDAETLEQKKERHEERLFDIKSEMSELERRHTSLNKELRRIGSEHDTEREDLIAARERLQTEYEKAKGEIEKSFGFLPLLLAGNLRECLRARLQEEQQEIIAPERLGRLREQVIEIKDRVFIRPRPSPPSEIVLNEKQSLFYSSRFDDVCSDVLGLAKDQQRVLLHDVGASAQRTILSRLAEAEREGSFLREAINMRERIVSEQRETDRKIQSTSSDPAVQRLIEEGRKDDLKLGALENEQRQIEGDLQRLEADLAARNRQITDRLEQRRARTKDEQTIRLAHKARQVLEAFIKRLAPQKLALLERYMQEMYGRLRKEEDPVHGIEINEETWQVILKDEKGRPLEKRQFSAGMKEIYALSLLWALSRASGCQLPIVIDTPVGRLDSTNRRALFEKYLPCAGHQVVVLCTDTEVDVEWAKRLQPYVAKQYRLDYDSRSQSTVIRPGFFF